MSSATPAIYTVHIHATRVPPWARLLCGAIGAACLAVLVVAATVDPDPSGTASHTSLGLAKCQFLLRSGLPCPSCGMTTSFAWFVRGNLAASFFVQPMGMLLAALATLTVWVAPYIAITGRPIHRLARFLPVPRIVFGVLLFGALAWGWKIWIHLNDLDGWGG